MKLTSLEKVAKVKVDMEGAKDVYKQMPLSRSDGSPMFSFRVFTIESNGHTPFHQHPFEHMNYVIQGHGAVVTESGEEREIKEGDFVLVLPNEKHQYKNTSQDELLILICAVPKEFE